MRLKEGLAVTSAALAAGGCASPKSQEVEGFLPGHPAHEITVDLKALPSRLPARVVSQAINATSIGLTFAYQHRYGAYEFGSAVRVEDNEYLSAGHMLYEPSGRPKLQADVCGGFEIQSATTRPSTNSTGLLKPLQPKDGTALQVEKSAGSYSGQDEKSKVPDVVLAKTNNTFAAKLPNLVQTRYFSGQLKTGEAVYLINYEPTAQGERRNPNENYLGAAQLRDKMNKPAIFGAIILYRLANGDYVALDGLRNYGASPENMGRPGMSGGGVYSAEGELVGTSVMGSTEPLTARQLLDHKVNINNIKGQKNLGIVVIQAINKATVNNLNHRLTQAPNCKQ